MNSESVGKLIYRIPGSHLLISSLPGSALRTLVESLGKPRDVNKHSQNLAQGKLDIKRHSPSILYISASPGMSTSVLKALPGKLDIKRHSPSILFISASLAMATSILKALPGKLDIKRHSPSILYILASLAMATSVFKALPGKLDIKRHSPLWIGFSIFRLNISSKLSNNTTTICSAVHFTKALVVVIYHYIGTHDHLTLYRCVTLLFMSLVLIRVISLDTRVELMVKDVSIILYILTVCC